MTETPAPKAATAAKKTTTPDAPTAGDRVAMLSLKADGTPDQINPSFIVPESDARAATEAQLVQTTVGRIDQAQQAATVAPVVRDDPETAQRRSEQEAAEESAKTKASSLVDEVGFTDDSLKDS